MSRSIQDVPGITPSQLERLRAAGVRTPAALLRAGGTAAARASLAERTGLSAALILRWVLLADLLRIDGVSGHFAGLLERSGVDSVDQLRGWSPRSLSEKLAQVNAELHLCKITPKPLTVSHWVHQAKRLGPALER